MTIIIPVELLLVEEVNEEIVAYGNIFTAEALNISLPWQASVIRATISVNFFIVFTVCLLTIFRNEIISICLIYVYFLLEMGPVGSYLGKNSFFYGCFAPFPCSEIFPTNILGMLIGSVLMELFIILWIKYNTR